MMKSFIISLLVVTSLYAKPKPNVVIIMTDDLGWQDVECYDIDEPTPFETPNIDRLASKGILFTNGYSPAPTCAPSRCAVLSGKFPARAQKTHVVGGSPPVAHGLASLAIDPWYSGQMLPEEVTIAEALASNGYRTGAVGKWHCAISHHAYPQPKDQGFHYATMNIGETKRMKDRSTGFATDQEGDPYRLDSEGYPYHQNTEDALEFLRQQSVTEADPFFLYYATWLVHTPIHTRSEQLLKKYCDKMGVEFPKDGGPWLRTPGQKNPYYAAMVETLDYHVGRIVSYLETTEDPRNPGHKLVDNTYIIFTSDNGGMERDKTDVITDNFPLDKGKINAREGGVRVPYLIAGPKIPSETVSHELVTGLDFYPTILGWTETPNTAKQHLDGIDLSDFLETPDTGLERDTLYWHFPHSSYQSAIREGNYKLIHLPIQDYLGKPALELFQLYDEEGKRVDIEEAKNLAKEKPELTQRLYKKLQSHLAEVKASRPYLNPKAKAKIPNKEKTPTAISQNALLTQDDLLRVTATFQENGAKVVEGQVFYTLNGTKKDEEWYPARATISNNTVTAVIPPEATHYSFAFIDENHFIVNYPEFKPKVASKGAYAEQAFAVPSAPKKQAKRKNATSYTPDAKWIYKTVDGQEMFMDVFFPEGYETNDQVFPALTFFHGGSWRVGETNWHYADCAYWAKRGVVAMSVDYRLSKRDGIENVPLECMKDAQASIRYLRANAKELKIDPNRIIAAGGSAGGQLAAALCMITTPETAHADDDLSISAVPNAAILYNPFYKCEEAYSPPFHVKADLPPMITFLGGKDPAITVESILEFQKSLTAQGNISETYIGNEGKHGFCNGRNPKNEFFYWSLQYADQFLINHGILSGQPAVTIPDGVKELQEGTDYAVYK